MRRMAGADAGMLYQERPHQHLHTAKIAVLDPPDGTTADHVADAVRERAVRIAPLRWVPERPPAKLHHFFWRTVDPDPAEHIRRSTVPAPGGPRELGALVSETVSTALPRHRPLWEVTVADGLEGGRVAVVLKLHHAAADGGSSARIITQLMDGQSPREVPPPDPEPAPRDLARAAAVDLRDTIAAAPDLVRRTRDAIRAGRERKQSGVDQPPEPFTAPATVYNDRLTPRRAFAYTVLPFDDLRAAKQAHGCTLNDVLLTLCGGAVRAHLAGIGRLPDEPLTTSVPVGVRRDDELDAFGNRVGNMYTSLATDVADPVERLAVVKANTRAARDHTEARRSERLLFEWQDYDWLFKPVVMMGHVSTRLAKRPAYNTIVSNVRGPEPLWLDGAEILEIQSMGQLAAGLGLNLTSWTYRGQMNIGLVACPEHVPDLWALADGIGPALAELRAAALRQPSSVSARSLAHG